MVQLFLTLGQTAPLYVLPETNRFKMPWVYAWWVAAKVIKCETGRNGTNQQFIGRAVRPHIPPASPPSAHQVMRADVSASRPYYFTTLSAGWTACY